MGQAALDVSLTCDGCDEPIDAFGSHIHTVSTVQKFTVVLPAAEGRSDEDLFEEDTASEPVLGTRSGKSWDLNFHDNNCVADYFDELRQSKIRIKLNRDTEDPYQQTAEELVGSNDTEGSDG